MQVTTLKDLCKVCEIKLALSPTGGHIYFVDGLDSAILGMGVRSGSPCVIYDRVASINLLIEQQEIEYNEAEAIVIRLERRKLGKGSPIFLITCNKKHLSMAVM